MFTVTWLLWTNQNAFYEYGIGSWAWFHKILNEWVSKMKKRDKSFLGTYVLLLSSSQLEAIIIFDRKLSGESFCVKLEALTRSNFTKSLPTYLSTQRQMFPYSSSSSDAFNDAFLWKKCSNLSLGEKHWQVHFASPMNVQLSKLFLRLRQRVFCLLPDDVDNCSPPDVLRK